MVRAGRLALWGCIGLIFVRGLGTVASPASHPGSSRLPVNSSLPASQDARAFAVDFAHAYLSFQPGDELGWARAVSPYLASGLRDRAAVALPLKGSGQQVAQATVARVISLGATRALITVASTFTDPGRPVRYLSVPVAWDANGGLDVFDLPALSAPPPLSDATFTSPPALSGPDVAEIHALVDRFLAGYLSGQQPSGLTYRINPRASLSQVGGLALVSLDALGEEGQPTAKSEVVQAAVHVRDLVSGAVYRLGYRLSLVHRVRWYVSSVGGGPSA